MAIEAGDDRADLGRVKDECNDRHPAGAARAGQDVYRVDLGQQSRPGSSAAERVDLTVLRGIGRRGVSSRLPAVPVRGSARAER